MGTAEQWPLDATKCSSAVGEIKDKNMNRNMNRTEL